MIIVRLIGGLGNQMFQYAMGRHLAELQSTVLKLDLSDFEAYKLRRYGLHCFHIWEHIATQTEIESITRESYIQRSKRFTQITVGKMGVARYRDHPMPKRIVLNEANLSYDPAILQTTGHLYIRGYWQSEKYFAAIQEIIRREFTIKYEQDPESKRLSDVIQSTESISLHVRRTDYVQDERTNQLYGVCDQSYYERAIGHITQTYKNPHFFIFSDDPDWVKANMNLGFPMTVIEHNGVSRDYEDLRLMSQCKHNIIVNSSFSWWGAWLNRNPNKIIVAPARWFADDERNSQTKELVPEGWIRL